MSSHKSPQSGTLQSRAESLEPRAKPGRAVSVFELPFAASLARFSAGLSALGSRLNGLALVFALALAASALAAPASRPNVVILFADDMGYGDLSSFGAPDLETPHIDSIGKNGIRFTRFYSNAPECSPSRTALLTGRHPQRVGGLECAIGVGNVGRYDEAVWLQQRHDLGLPAAEGTIAQAFKRAGYATALFGKWHLGYEPKFSPNAHGFDEALYALGGAMDYISHKEDNGDDVLRHNGQPVKIEGYFTDIIADRALAWLEQRRGAPYFLYVPFTAPHFPYQMPGDAPVAAGAWQKGTREVYAKMIEHLDRRVGDILRAIEQTPEAKNTIVIFLSDNGGTGPGNNQPFRGAKSSMWEGGIRVPFLAQWPAVIRPGLETAYPAQNIDLTATLLAVAGLAPVGKKLDGQSLLDVWRGQTDAVPRTLFWRYKREASRRKAVLDGDFKLVIDNGQKELINLAQDPGEKTNLIASMPEKAAALEAKLTAWETDVAAPRLKDFKPGPK